MQSNFGVQFSFLPSDTLTRGQEESMIGQTGVSHLNYSKNNTTAVCTPRVRFHPVSILTGWLSHTSCFLHVVMYPGLVLPDQLLFL